MPLRYMLLLHWKEADLHARSPEWAEEAVAFLARFDDELATNSELEWTEVLASEVNAIHVGPGEVSRPGWYNSSGKPLSRVWVVRVESSERVVELAGQLAGELDTWIEVRECLPSAQRP